MTVAQSTTIHRAGLLINYFEECQCTNMIKVHWLSYHRIWMIEGRIACSLYKCLFANTVAEITNLGALEGKLTNKRGKYLPSRAYHTFTFLPVSCNFFFLQVGLFSMSEPTWGWKKVRVRLKNPILLATPSLKMPPSPPAVLILQDKLRVDIWFAIH